MLNRRDFISASLMAGGAGLLRPAVTNAAPVRPSGYFAVHPFVEQHPEAVFIMPTHVPYKTDSETKKKTGLGFARSVLLPADPTGIPVTHTVSVKPNLTWHIPVDQKNGFTIEDTMGICTDVDFSEGVFEGLKDLGFSGGQIHARDINSSTIIEPRGWVAMGERTGADVKTLHGKVGTDGAENFNWVDIPDGVLHRRMPYLWPFNTRDSWTLNLAKFKGHTMGLTLTCKNMQGAIGSPYQGFCQKWDALQRMDAKNLNPDARKVIGEALARHAGALPRWDKPEIKRDDPKYIRPYHYDVLCQEIWAHRTIDNLSVSPMGLCVVEGIYGRDGDFNNGPNPHGNENNWNGRAWDYMANFILFGKDPYRVDLVGKWLGGHEPGNFGFFHIAMERGKLDVLNPMNIPLYRWEDGRAVRTPLTSFPRTPLRTSYLHQDYNGKNEPLFHLCDEPFDYGKVRERTAVPPAEPGSRILNEGYPAAHTPQVIIEYAIPEQGPVMMEILDEQGQTREVLTNALDTAGYHMAVWNTERQPAGKYRYRFRYGGFTQERDVVLRKA